jgi:hypothetical protein
MPDEKPAEMGADLWEKQAPARPDKAADGVFPDAAPAKAKPAPAKKAAKAKKAK